MIVNRIERNFSAKAHTVKSDSLDYHTHLLFGHTPRILTAISDRLHLDIIIWIKWKSGQFFRFR